MRPRTMLAMVTVLLISLLLTLGCSESESTPKPTATPQGTATPQPTATPAPEPIELTAISMMLPGDPKMQGFVDFIDRVNERANGELVIDLLGGVEVIPLFDQAAAVRSGAVDIGSLMRTTYEDLVPGSRLQMLSQISLDEERRPGGFHDTTQELYAEAGLYRLGIGLGGRDPAGGEFYLHFTDKKVGQIEDLAGLTITTYGTACYPLADAFGMAKASIAAPEMYMALDQGLVDVFMESLPGYNLNGFHEVTKYTLDHPFFRYALDNVVNLDTWNALPKHLQDLLIEVQIKVEGEQEALTVEQVDEARQAMIAEGHQFIKLSPADAEEFLDTVYEATLEDARKTLGAEFTDKIMATLE